MFDFSAIHTIRDLVDEMYRIFDLPEPQRSEEAAEFMQRYRACNEFADENIGYLTGYMTDSDKSVEMQKLFSVSHPFSGSAMHSPQQAFDIGTSLSRKES